MSLLIPVGVAYDADPDRVERILIEEARKGAGEIPGLLAHPEPFVCLIPGFSDSALVFTLICRVNSFADQYLAQHELRKRILRRFRKEGIDMPFPQRDVRLTVKSARELAGLAGESSSEGQKLRASAS